MPTARKPGAYLIVLAAAATLIWIVAAIHPVSRSTWALENILLFVGVGWLVSTYRRWPLSNFSYTFVFIFLVLHVIGSHYTYSQVPMGDWLRSVFGGERNAYDRLLHFLFGFLLFQPWRETCRRAWPAPRGRGSSRRGRGGSSPFGSAKVRKYEHAKATPPHGARPCADRRRAAVR